MGKKEEIIGIGDTSRKRSDPLAVKELFVPRIELRPEKSGRSRGNNSTNSQSGELKTNRLLNNYFQIGRKTPIFSQLKLKSRESTRAGEGEKIEKVESFHGGNSMKTETMPKAKFLNLMLKRGLDGKY